ncbi:MAG: hypothetical protein K2M15_08890 [Oscillospiraceae bacterium]|nr:hypothetical protein [Oscillospiraceae bacterium]MDE7170926.1 hypothetical protein [Oscillospiraceae bacterium]
MKELESLSAFQARTSGFVSDSLPHSGGFETNANLPLKVGVDGEMKPFMGNTVVFPIPEHIQRQIGLIQKRLYQLCGPALAEPLEASSFHITLHDLLSGTPAQDLSNRIARAREPALTCLKQISEKSETIRLRSTALFNMVNTSMVLGFAPADETSCARLMAYYELFQEVVPLGYPLTPHVTVAYFRPGTVTAELTEKLRQAVAEVGQREKLSLELSAETLEYQLFSDMNHYWADM